MLSGIFFDGPTTAGVVSVKAGAMYFFAPVCRDVQVDIRVPTLYWCFGHFSKFWVRINDWGESCDCCNLEIVGEPRSFYTRPAVVSKLREITLTLKGASYGIVADHLHDSSIRTPPQADNWILANIGWLT